MKATHILDCEAYDFHKEEIEKNDYDSIFGTEEATSGVLCSVWAPNSRRRLITWSQYAILESSLDGQDQTTGHTGKAVL